MACVGLVYLAVFPFAIKTTVSQVVGRSATVGETVVLPCSTTLDSPVDWLYQPSSDKMEEHICMVGNVLSAYTTRFSINSAEGGVYDLHIHHVQPSDAGVYTCVEDRGLGGRHATQLDVEEGVDGRLATATRNVTRWVGESVSFTCTTKTSHPIRWTRSNTTKTVPTLLFIGTKKSHSTSPRYYVTIDSVTSTLTVSHLELDDSGAITCQESTADDTDGLSFGLTVIQSRGACGVLTTIPRKVIRRVDESVNFTCATNTSHLIRWTRSKTAKIVPTVLFIGTKRSRSTSARYNVIADSVTSTLTLSHLELGDSGVITCREWTADVTDGLSFDLTVIRPRVVRTSDHIQLIREQGIPAADNFRAGEAVVLEATEDATSIELPCHTSLDTAVDWWYQSSLDVNVREVGLNGDIVIDFRSRLSIKSNTPGDYYLVINSPSVSDSGIYTCVEDAGQGPGRLEVRLIVNTNIADNVQGMSFNESTQQHATRTSETRQWSPAGVVVIGVFLSWFLLAAIIIVVSHWRGIILPGVIKKIVFSRAKRRDAEQRDAYVDALRSLSKSSSMPKQQSSCSIQTTPKKTNDTMTSPTYPDPVEQHPIIDRHQRETDF